MTNFEKELKKKPQGQLVRMCEGKGLDHTGDKQALIARLVEAEEAEPEPPEKPPAPEEEEPPAPEEEEPPAEVKPPERKLTKE